MISFSSIITDSVRGDGRVCVLRGGTVQDAVGVGQAVGAALDLDEVGAAVGYFSKKKDNTHCSLENS